jgi:hypothetical protein
MMRVMHDQAYRDQLVRLLEGDDAHMRFEEAVADFPEAAINAFPSNVAYTPWHLVEHLRITQRDILDYIVDPEYEEPSWPIDYWPARDATATPAEFLASVEAFLADRDALRDLVTDPKTDLDAPMPNTPGHTIAREIRIAGDHCAYHVGEFAILRQVMGTWPPDHR